MITQSGVHVQKIGGADGTPTAMDIAVHSGRICRFGGAVWYPLLAHLIFVGLLAYKRSSKIENLIWGFLHDAHEVVTSDVPRPFKCDCMRKEQEAIDRRILTEWFGEDGWLDIDYDLIKRCDEDACDIEAVVLGVPGYADIEIEFAKDYKGSKGIYADPDDTKMFKRIRHSPFFESTIHASAGGVLAFARALEAAKDGRRHVLLNYVKGWNLL